MKTKGENIRNTPGNKEIINALPPEINKKLPVKDRIGDIIAAIAMKKVPVNSLIRAWILGSAQAKIAIGYLAYAIRSNFVNSTEKQRLLNETNLNAALKLLGAMGYLRGAVIKVGQVLGNLPHVIPDEIAEIMESLQFEAPPMHYSMIREVFLDEMGKEPEDVFASFEKSAFAAASLGQVHRARLKSGEHVAVKIQYPNMTRTIRSDLRSLRAIMQPMRLRSEHKYLLYHLKDAEQMLTAEADYRKEARFMKKAGKLFNAEEQIIVPRVRDKYSTERVLTMDYILGRHLKEFLASDPTQEMRDHFGHLISTAIMRIWFQTKTLYTDLNPGNFLFMDDGKLGLIDFGNRRNYSGREWRFQCRMEKALLEKDVNAMNEAFAEVCLFNNPGEMEPERSEFMLRNSSWQTAPLMENRTFDFGNPDFYKNGIDLNAEALKRGYNRYNSLFNWWIRAISGHRAITYRLRSRFNYHAIYKAEQAQESGAPVNNHN